MNIFSILIILFIGGGFITMAVCAIFFEKKQRGVKRWISTTAFVFMAIGAIGFLGAGLSSAGGLNWLPATFEWPIGTASGVLVMPDGHYIVPHSPSGRVQVYDADLKYLRGWRVDASGGSFILGLAGTNQIAVITARGQKQIVYLADGSLVSSGTYTPKDYSDFPVSGESVNIPTPWWLWSFTHPLYSWPLIALGMVTLLILDHVSKKRTPPR